MKPNLFRLHVLVIALFAVSTPVLAHHLPAGTEGVDEFAQARMVSAIGPSQR